MTKYNKYFSNCRPTARGQHRLASKILKTVPSNCFKGWGMGKCCLGDSKGKHWGTEESSCDCRAKPWPREAVFTISLNVWILFIPGTDVKSSPPNRIKLPPNLRPFPHVTISFYRLLRGLPVLRTAIFTFAVAYLLPEPCLGAFRSVPEQT